MTSVCVEIATSSGERELCKIEFTQGVPVTLSTRSARFGELLFTDDNLFAAMSAYRLRLEQDGIFFCATALVGTRIRHRWPCKWEGGKSICCPPEGRLRGKI